MTFTISIKKFWLPEPKFNINSILPESKADGDQHKPLEFETEECSKEKNQPQEWRSHKCNPKEANL